MPENEDNGSRSNGGSHTEHLEGRLELAMLPDSEGIRAPLAPPTLASSVFELDLYQELNLATDVADLSSKLLGLANRLGFSDCCFARTDIEDLGDLVSLPQGLLDDYEESRFFDNDLVADCANNNHFPVFNSMIEEYLVKAPFECDIFRQNRERFRLFRSYGYFDGCLIPARKKAGAENVVLSVHSKGENPVDFRRRVEENKSVLHLIAEAADYVITAKFRDLLWGAEKDRDVQVGPRPLQLLTALAKDDLTLNEAASKLCISIHTANQHIAAARKAFCVHTTNGAICEAIRVGLIRL